MGTERFIDDAELRAMCDLDGDWGGTLWGESILRLLSERDAMWIAGYRFALKNLDDPQVRADRDALAEHDRMTCHRDGDECSWVGCPNQHDLRACEGCFLIKPNEARRESDLLAEVRGLRADLRRALSASPRQHGTRKAAGK